MPQPPRNVGLIRQWKVLLALVGRAEGCGWRELQAAFPDVSLRTIRRDVDALICAGFRVTVREGVVRVSNPPRISRMSA